MSQTMICLSGRHGYHVAPRRSSPIRHFGRIAGAEDFGALNVLEALTDDRIRDEIGQIEVAPAHERVYGEHAETVMAAFTHWNADGGLFSDGSYGVFCFGLSEDTATAQALDHLGTFLAATDEQPTGVQMSLYSFSLTGEVADLRSTQTDCHRDFTRELGKQLRAIGVSGILFPRPLHAGGECVAAFKATLIAEYLSAVDLEFNWNGKRIEDVTRMNSDNDCGRKLP